MSCYDSVTDELRQAGLRMTPQRLLVMDTLFHHDGHITAEDIHAEVQAQYPYVDLSTVYRTLQLFIEQGLVAELRVTEGPTQYEALLDNYHHHAICQRCGAMFELESGVLRSVKDELLSRHGFRANLTHMAIYGVCQDCTEHPEPGTPAPPGD